MAIHREFVAGGRSVPEVAEVIGVDYLMYLEREAMNEAARVGNERIEQFCNACFTGVYPTGDVTRERLEAIETERITQGRPHPVPG
jgi:amidophosphoribosyltransferase